MDTQPYCRNGEVTICSCINWEYLKILTVGFSKCLLQFMELF